ncbi:hypothetical protein G9A89_020211 [Geosiphon pyriformis]|nr:hypothetical protein G9A89_020211 [Geosiphon pyriformis]
MAYTPITKIEKFTGKEDDAQILTQSRTISTELPTSDVATNLSTTYLLNFSTSYLSITATNNISTPTNSNTATKLSSDDIRKSQI